MKVYLSRWVCLDVGSNLSRLAEECREAAAAGAELVVFPESFLHGYTRAIDPARVREAFASISRLHAGMVFVFGSISEERRNRMTVWRAGEERARYDKVHLFEPNGELALWDEGERYVAIKLGELTLGLVNCNDLRFPEQARALVLRAGCNALLAVAWWPWRRDWVWRSLLRARAIENAAWVLGCCVAASEHPGERFSGAGNYVFNPHGEPVRTADDHLYTLDVARSAPPIVDPRAGFRDITAIEVFEA